MILALCAAVGVAVGLAGLGTGIDHRLQLVDDAVRRHEPSGALHIVEIDAHSIQQIDRWPWPRGHHARVVDALRKAGAASITFDIDFSAHGDPAEDARFAAALARYDGRAVLPTFGQHAGGSINGWTDSLPIPALREHANLAAVSILPDSDGHVRRAPLGTMTDGLPRPSLSAMIAGVSGVADQDFPIDFAIDPQAIPRHSFIDIRDGRFDPAQIAGKHILIGATAIEMGDRYATPGHGVIPGVVIQALAAETLAAGKASGSLPRELGWVLPLLLALAGGWLLLRQTSRLALGLALAGVPVAMVALAIAAHGAFNWIFALAPAMTMLALCGMAAIAGHLATAAHHRLTHDVQTGLPNRHALRKAFDGDAGGQVAGIAAVRIADFDKLAASLGEAVAGDLVMRIAERVRLVSQGGTVHRIEDRVLAWICPAGFPLDERAAALRAMMLNPIEAAGRRIDVTLGLGFAACDGASNREALLAQAMLGADRALANGLALWAHDSKDDEVLDRELSLLGELDEAIGSDDLYVAYQPKLCLVTRRIVSAEALVRWNHRTRGPLRPDLFIPLAERNDRIDRLTLHVLGRTLRDLARWRGHGLQISVAVNISAKLLNSRPFLDAVGPMLEQACLPAGTLVFEVTESAAMSNISEAADALHRFREMGVAISMDDYGTGQSTLSYLKLLPLNELKIDRSFVQFAHQNRSDALLVQSTINLAHELGLKVVAEGVEDAECLAFLTAAECDLVQGYHVSKPLPRDEFERFLDLHAQGFRTGLAA